MMRGGGSGTAAPRPWLWAALVTAFALVQFSIFDQLRIRGVKPDLMLVLPATLGLLYGPVPGVAVGLAGGFLQDLALGQYLGLHALTRAIVGLLAGLAEPRIWKENWLLPPIAAFCFSLLGEGMVWLLLLALGRVYEASYAWGAVIVPAALYNGVLGWVVYALVYRLGRRQEVS